MLKSIYHFFHRHYHLRYHGVYKHAKKLFVFDLGLLALALLMLGASIFFVFWKPTLAGWIDISFSFGEGRVKSGEEIKITVDYKNRSKETLSDALLAVHLPGNFIVDRNKTPVSFFSKNSTISVGNIKSGGSGRVEIYGQIFAEPNQNETASAYLTYFRQNTNAQEQKIGGAFFKAIGSVITAQLTLPESTFPGRELPASLRLTNDGEKTISDISVKYDSTKPFAPENEMKNFSLKPGESKIISGSISSPNQPGKYTQKIEVGLTLDNVWMKQVVIEKELSVFYPEIISSATLVGQAVFADAGQTLPVKIFWKNNSQFKLDNLRLRLSTPPGLINLQATAKENNLTVEGTDLIADQKTRPALANGQPGVSDEFTINLILLAKLNPPAGTALLEIKPKMEAEMADVPGQSFVQEGDAARLPLATQLALNAHPVYYTADNDQLGRGPLPPKIGETTKYWIFITVKNTSNPIGGNAFQATLGDGVDFTGRQSVSIGRELRFDANSKIVSWDQNIVPADSEVGLYFEVSVKPTPAQLGKKIILIKNAAYQAADQVTGKKFDLKTGAIDNTLGAGDKGTAKGAAVVY